jgi:4-hydroxy-4-methyl-2-oxoglutarate aldolase
MTIHNTDRNPNHTIYLDLPRPAKSVIDSIREIGSADMHEGLGMDTLMDPSIRPVWPGAKAIGPALTVLNAAGDTLMLHRAVELCQPGDILVIVSEAPTRTAMWGSMVTTVSIARQVAGAVVDGNVRDTRDIREKQFPVWSRGISPCGSTRKGPGGINVPVQCGGVWINPGDLILADDDGVVVIPIEEVERASANALARMARELDASPRLKKGVSPYELWNMAQIVKSADIPEIKQACPEELKKSRSK